VSLSFRVDKPCERCQDGQRLCRLVREELQATVRHLNDLEAFAQSRGPEAEVVFECHLFRPRSQSARNINRDRPRLSTRLGSGTTLTD